MENPFAYEFQEEPRVSSAIQSDNLSSSTSPPVGRAINYHPKIKLNNRSMASDGVAVTKYLSRMINNIIIQEPTYYKSKCALSSHDNTFSHIDDPSLNYHNTTELTHSNVPKVRVEERDYVYSPEQYIDPDLVPSHYHCQKSYSDISTTVLHSMADKGGGGDDLMIDQDEDSWNSSLEPFARDRCNTWPLPKPAYFDPNVSSQSTVQKGVLISKQTPSAFGYLAPFSIKEEIEEEGDEATKPTKSDSFVNNSAGYKYLPHSDNTSIAPGEWADTYDESFDQKLLNQHQQLVCANQNSVRQGEVDTIQPLPELTPDDIILDDQQLHANLQGPEIKYDHMTFTNQNNTASNPFTRSLINQNANLSNTDILRFIPTTTTSSASRKNAWGNYSYADLITRAIQTSADKRLTLSQIYDWMVQYIPYFKDKGDSNSSAGWKNSIRHNLSLHNRFIRLQNEGAGKSSWWMINPDAKPGKTARRRAATLDPKAYEKKKGRVRKRISHNNSLSSICDNTSSGGYYVNSSSISSLKQIGAPCNLNAHPNAFKPFPYNRPVENGDNKLFPNVYTCGLMSEPRESYYYNPERSLNSTLLKPFTNHYNNRSILSDSSPLTFSSSRNSLSPLSGKGSKELLYHQSPTNHSSDYTETDYGTCNRSSLSYLATPMDYANLPEFRNRAISCVATFSDNNLTRKIHYANHQDNFCEPEIKIKQKSSYKSQLVEVIPEDSRHYPMVTNLETNFQTYPHYDGNDRSTSSLNKSGLQHDPSIPYNYKGPQTVMQCDENQKMDWSAKPIYTPVSDKQNPSKININADYTCEQWPTDNRFSNHNESNSYQRPMVSQLLNSRDVETNYKGEQIQKPQRYHPTENYYFSDEPLNDDEESVAETAPKVYLDLSEIRQWDRGFKHSVPSNSIYYNQSAKTCQDLTNNFVNANFQNLDHNMAPEVDSMLGSNSVSSSRLNLTPPALGSTPPSQHEFSLLRQTLNKPYNQTSGNRIYQGTSSISDLETRDYNNMTRSTKNCNESDRNRYLNDHSACQCDEDVSFNSYYLQSQSHDYDFKPYSPCREQVNHKESNRAFLPLSMTRTVPSNAIVNVNFNHNESSSSFN